MRLALKLSCSVAFLVVACQEVRGARLAALLGHWDATMSGWVCAAVAIGLASAVINSFKWWLLLRAVEVRLPWRRVLYHYLVGYFLNTILTGSGEVKRVVDVGRETGRTSAVLTSVFVERWTGVTSQLTLSLAALLLATSRFHGLEGLMLLNLGGCALLLGLWVALVSASRGSAGGDRAPLPHGGEGAGENSAALGPRGREAGGATSHALRPLEEDPSPPPSLGPEGALGRAWRGGLEAFRELRAAPGAVGAALAISLLVPVLVIACHACLGIALGTGLGFIWVVPIASVFGQMPVSINGLGVQEIAYLWLFELTGMGPEQAMAISVLAHGVKLAVGGLGGLLSLWAGDARQEAAAARS